MNERNYNLEAIRIIAFISVIAIHVSNYYCRAFGHISDYEYIFSLIIDTLARISVPCFFMITGALLVGRDEPLYKHWIRIRRFLICFVVWSAIYYLWNIYYMQESFDLKNIFYDPVTEHLWYMYAIIPIYLVLPFLQIMCKHMSIRHDRAFIVLISLAVVFNYVNGRLDQRAFYDLPLIGDRIYTYYLFLGFYINKYKKHIPVSQKQVLGFFVLFMFIIVVTTAMISYNMNDHYEDFLNYGNPLLALASAAFFLYFIRLDHYKIPLTNIEKETFDIISGCTFGIYLIHILFLDIFKKFITPQMISAFLVIPIMTVFIALISFICVYIIRLTKLGKHIT